MVGHEAVAEQGKALQPTTPAQKVQIDEAVGVGFQNVLAGIASLSDMMRGVDSDDTRETSDEMESGNTGRRISRKRPVCPRFPTRYFYQPKPLRTLEEIRADILGVQREAEGLLDELVQGGAK